MRYNEFLKAACPPLDLEWRKYRRRGARHRVDERLRKLGLSDYAAYLDYLRGNPEEEALLPDRMRVTVSRFFRERDRWEILAAAVLPVLLKEGLSDRPLRLWSAGCCGGEEPYSLAMLWQESFPGREVEILASDIDEASLVRARRAVYDHGSLREVSKELRQKWFQREGVRWRLAEEIRDRVRFFGHNLMTDPPPEGLDLVCCRYLAFTYYRGARRLEAARRLRQALRPGGALMIARKEELGVAAELFIPWPEAPGVFRKPGQPTRR